MEWLFNPWVISLIIVAVIASNIAALKYTAHMKFGQKEKIDYLREKQQREAALKAEQEKRTREFRTRSKIKKRLKHHTSAVFQWRQIKLDLNSPQRPPIYNWLTLLSPLARERATSE